MRTRFLVTVIASAVLLFAAGLASATVVGTKHDMTSGTQSKNYDNVDNTGQQVCVYCHTPHNSASKVFGPIWNRTNSEATYTMYGTTTANTETDATPGTDRVAGRPPSVRSAYKLIIPTASLAKTRAMETTNPISNTCQARVL